MLVSRSGIGASVSAAAPASASICSRCLAGRAATDTQAPLTRVASIARVSESSSAVALATRCGATGSIDGLSSASIVRIAAMSAVIEARSVPLP